MPIPRLTALQFEQLMSTDINQRNSQIDTTYGPIKDFSIRPPAKIFEQQNERIRTVYQLGALQSVDDLLTQDVDAYIFNEQVLRSLGTPAYVTLTFSRASKPAANIPIPANFPVATTTDSGSGVQITFVTLQSVTMLAAGAAAYFNPQTQRYEISVPAASITSGPSTTVGKNTVRNPLRPMLNFDSVTNTQESTGGLPPETNSQVVQRYFLRIQGTELGPAAGLSRYVRQLYGNVQDLYVVYGNDPFLTRADHDAGAVDAWVLGSSPISRTMSVAFPGVLVLIPLDRQPGIQVQTVISGGTFVEGVDYVYAPDTGIYSSSTRGRDGIIFLPTGASPAIGATVAITYTYDNLILALQTQFSQSPEYEETGRDALFRRGQELDIAIQGVLSISAGQPNLVLAQVQQTLLDLFNGNATTPGYMLGQSVTEFKIDQALSRVPGVDNFVYTQLAIVGDVGVADIPVGKNQYARLLAANLSVTLST